MLGKGKFASVFQGSWENCPVAIKALHPYCSDQAVNDFRREAEILRYIVMKFFSSPAKAHNRYVARKCILTEQFKKGLFVT